MSIIATEPVSLPATSIVESNAVPHALAVAHASLTGALTQADELYRRTLRFPNPGPVLDAIERFVHELQLIPTWYAELQQRSRLVEQRCPEGGNYDVARQQALHSHSGTPVKLSGAKLALERLRNPSTQSPRFLQEVVDVRKNIDSLLADDSAGLTPNAIAAFKSWRDECRSIQLAAERLHVDACWYLFHVYESAGPSPAECDQAARAILQTDMGGAHLEDLRLAAESMMAWAVERGLPDRESESESGDPRAPNADLPAREWPAPEEHTTAKVWSRKDGVLCLSTKTDDVHDGRVEFAPTVAGEATYQMRFMQLMCFKYPETATLAEVIEQVYPDEFTKVQDDPAALDKLLRRVRALVTDVRNKKLGKAGLNPSILPPLNIEASINAGIGLRLAHLHRVDDHDLDDADRASE